MTPAAVVALVFSLLVAVVRFDRVFQLLATGDLGQRVIVMVMIAIVVTAGAAILRRHSRKWASSEFLSDREVQWGIALIVAMVLLALYAPLITEHDPQYALYGRLRDRSSAHWFGTDAFGRDALTRMVYGARISLAVALSAGLLAVIVGIVVGASAALSGERTDNTLMRLVDAGIAFPRTFLLLALFALSPRVSLFVLVVILGFTSWFDIARLVRAEVLSMRRSEFVVATAGLGFQTPRTMFQHILPNVAGPIIVSATLTIGYLILIESGLSYIGVGLQAGTPSWGTLINEGYPQLRNDPHLTLVPGALIATTVIGFSLIGDGIRRSLDPHRA